MTDFEQSANEYVNNAIDHGKASELGDSKKANKCHDLLIKAYKVILEHGSEGEKYLTSLLDHENKSVRLWAAAHSLKIDEKRALEVLRNLCEDSEMLGFTASITLEEWENGTLEFP